MKRRIVIHDAETIRALAADERIDRRFAFWPPVTGLFLARLLHNLSYRGAHFPHMTAKDDAARMARHTEVWEAFSAKAAAMAAGPEELEPLASWIRGEREGEPGILVQQLIGQFFKPDFLATTESWEAALALREVAISTNLPKILWWQITGKANHAKKLLGSLLDEDIVAMHGVAVAAHNLVATMQQLRTAYAAGSRMAPETAVRQTLSAPPVVYRQALAAGAVKGCPYSKFTLFLLKLKEANKDGQCGDMVFMSGTWSRCPAEQWIPAVIAGTWKRAIRSN